MTPYDELVASLGLEPSSPRVGRGIKRDGTTKSTPKCGTYSGYNTHIAKREDACTGCRAAKAAYMRDYYDANRERIVERRRLAARTPGRAA